MDSIFPDNNESIWEENSVITESIFPNESESIFEDELTTDVVGIFEDNSITTSTDNSIEALFKSLTQQLENENQENLAKAVNSLSLIYSQGI